MVSFLLPFVAILASARIQDGLKKETRTLLHQRRPSFGAQVTILAMTGVLGGALGAAIFTYTMAPSSGAKGEQGIQGPPGVEGAAGAAGADGAGGERGPQGERGWTGRMGQRGPRGASGAHGANGANGANGADGADGATGARGATGAVGPRGPKGDPAGECTPGERIGLGDCWCANNQGRTTCGQHEICQAPEQGAPKCIECRTTAECDVGNSSAQICDDETSRCRTPTSIDECKTVFPDTKPVLDASTQRCSAWPTTITLTSNRALETFFSDDVVEGHYIRQGEKKVWVKEGRSDENLPTGSSSPFHLFYENGHWYFGLGTRSAYSPENLDDNAIWKWAKEEKKNTKLYKCPFPSIQFPANLDPSSCRALDVDLSRTQKVLELASEEYTVISATIDMVRKEE